MRFIFLLILPLLALSGMAVVVDKDDTSTSTSTSTNTNAGTSTNAMEYHVQEMVTWLRQNDGYLNSKLEIRRADPSDPASYFGMFAKAAIQENERLLEIPSELMISVEEDEDHHEQLCRLAHVLLEQMELGDDDDDDDQSSSEFAPYINYLKQQPHHQLPATWSEPGKNLMRRVLGEIERHATELPPADMVDFIEDEFLMRGCFDDDDGNGDGNGNGDNHNDNHDHHIHNSEWQQHVVALVIQRAWEEVLIPIYDMINLHASDPNIVVVLNTDTTDTDNGNGNALHVKARRAIAAGDELYLSYDDCRYCGNIPEYWSTPEILRDFGFVESYPRTFYFGDADVLFQVHQEEDFQVDQDEHEHGETTTATTTTTHLKVTWLEGSPNKRAIEWLEMEHERLQDMIHGGMMEDRRALMPQKEYEVIFQFHHALIDAFYAAIKKARFHNTSDDGVCFADGTCADTDLPPWFRYKDLDKPLATSDDYYRAIYQSETLVWGVDHFNPVGKVLSHYQRIEYSMDTVKKEMCFYLDGIFQICASYRPQYHEMGVHATARYLPEGPKRVLWVGGGDAMFLHEILKYPDLELAVGLELDQKVTRGAFKYFGAQPHWDNEKVQWWFGDASKSLLMLPEDYFGSFDMVLVDLSDTVLSLSVTKEMDIIGALSLLLKPGGIFAMNELFFKRISDVFEHTVQIKFHHVPKIGDQAFVLASNDFDFLDRNLTDHNLENNLYIEPLSPDYDRFELVHDYRNNPNSSFKKLCKADSKEEELLEQEGSPGIFMVVEAQEVTANLDSIKDVQDAVTKALEEGVGLKVDSVAQRTKSTELSDGASGETFLVLREGYVVIRTWPEHAYCAFDIHLWSAFEKHEAAKKAVVASVGGKMATASAYRIVAGGMFGVSTWKEDAKGHGPQIHKMCDPSEEHVRDAPTDPSTVEIALQTGLSLVRDENFVAAVVCESKEECPTIDLLKKNAKVSKVIVLSSCPDVTPTDEYSEEGRRRIEECEKGILKTLQGSVTDEKRLRAIVLDTGSKRLMGQIVLRVLSKKSDAVDILASDIIALATIKDQGAESWRTSFLDLFGKQVVTIDPVFRAEVLFNSTDSSMELGISSSGDKFFMQLLADTATSVERESGLAVEIREIHGGLWRPEPQRLMLDEEAEKLFSLESYDRTSPLDQWRSQQPLGHQTLFQLEIRTLQQKDAVEVKDLELGMVFSGVVYTVHPDGTYRIGYGGGDVDHNVQRSEIHKLDGSPNNGVPPADDVKEAIKQAFSSMDSMAIEVQEMTSSGDGCVMVAFWSRGSAIVVWDGRIHIDVNLITYFESKKIPANLLVQMRSRISGLELILHDEQPRGFGRVVNFQKDIGLGARQDPLWA